MRHQVMIGLWVLGAILAGCTGSGSQDSAVVVEIERADRLWSQGDIPRAMGVLQTVVGEHPDSFDAWYRLGIHRLEGSPSIDAVVARFHVGTLVGDLTRDQIRGKSFDSVHGRDIGGVDTERPTWFRGLSLQRPSW